MKYHNLHLVNCSLFSSPLAMSTIISLVNNTWMLVSTLLVFIMHLGFALSGLTNPNTVNILFKNVAVLSISILSFSIVGLV